MAARELLDGGIKVGANIKDPLEPAFADAFVDALAEGLPERFRGVAGDLKEGAGRVGRSSNAEREHGLIEVLQNADDLGAKQVLFQLVKGDAGDRSLRIAHDGGRVRAPNVLAMTLALVTTKTDDDKATGKFGVGIGTLSRMADSFAVHSWPYAFGVRNQDLTPAEPLPAMDGIYDPAPPDTLLILDLKPNYPVNAFEAWFDAFEPEGLLFLRSVRRLVLLDGAEKVADKRQLHELGRNSLTLHIGGSAVPAYELSLRDDRAGRSWTRISMEERVPDGLNKLSQNPM